jgi:branched-chain amino acid transport system permease protein
MAFISIIIDGALMGGLYALFAVGLSLIFGIMRVVNIAHGDLIVLAAFVALVAVRVLGIVPLASTVVVVPILFVVGYALQRGVLNRTLGAGILPPLLVTFGISVIIENGLQEIFGADTRRLNSGALETASLIFPGDLFIGVFPLLIFAVAIVVILVIQFIFYHTEIGRAFRATSDDPVTAELMGINNRHLYALATGIAFAVTGIAGVFLAIRSNFDPSMGPSRLIFAFESIIIGGLGNPWGTLIGAIILSIAQAIGSAYSLQWSLLSGHFAFLVVLLLRPNGLFPRMGE